MRHNSILAGLVLIVTLASVGESLGQGPPYLSKEFVYLGNGIIAVESGSADTTSPTALVAVASSTTQINLTWSAPALGAPHHYGVWRLTGGSWSRLGPTTLLNYSDLTVNSATTYLYKIASENAADQTLGWSNVDIATTVVFTDDPLVPQVTVVKAAHVTDLRTAVNAVRAAAGLGAATWTNASLSGAWIQAIDVSELRSRLNEAVSALGLTIPTYADTTLSGIAIKKIHFDQLRQGVR